MALNSVEKTDGFETGWALTEEAFNKLEYTVNDIIDHAFEVPSGGKNGEVLGCKNSQVTWISSSAVPENGVPGMVLTKTNTGYAWKDLPVTGYTKAEINATLGCNNIKIDEKGNSNIQGSIKRLNGVKNVSVTNTLNNIIDTIENIENDVENLQYEVDKIGNLNKLNTENKDTLVDAINEVLLKSGETTLQEPVIVETEHVGSRKKGYLFREGITFTEFVKIICGLGSSGTYIMPTVFIKFKYYSDTNETDLSVINANTYLYDKGLEIGSRLAFSIRSIFTKNDCGTLTGIDVYELQDGIYKKIYYKTFDNIGNPFDDTIINTWHHNLDNDKIVITKDMTYKLVYNYSEGAKTTDDDGNIIPGYIRDGSLEVYLKIPCYYSIYYGHDDNSTEINGSLIMNGTKVSKVNSFDINVVATDKRFWFAIPTSMIRKEGSEVKNITVTSKGMNNYDKVLDLMVEHASSDYDGTLKSDYTLFVLTRKAAFGGTDTYTVKISE